MAQPAGAPAAKTGAAEGRIHGEPPFEARPCRSLARRRGALQDLREVVGHVVLGVLVEPGGEVPSEDVVRRHAGRPSVASGSIAGIGVERRPHDLERSVEA